MRLPFALAIIATVVGIPTAVFTLAMMFVAGPFALVIPAFVVWQVGRKVGAARRREVARQRYVGLAR